MAEKWCSVMPKAATQQHESVKNYYGKVLSTTKDLKTSACTNKSKPTKDIRNILKLIPHEVRDKYYGCGSVLPGGIEDLTVVDLGSGSGQDCYLASAIVGPKGRVIGIDMTDELLVTARENIPEFAANLGWSPNLEFRKGFIEYLSDSGLRSSSVDICISNCVLNLSPRKDLVLKGVYGILKPGGEFFFSDVFASRRLPEELRNHDILLGECIGGALYVRDFIHICHQVGFADPRPISCSTIEVQDEELSGLVGPAVKFYSITFRLFKVDNLETTCEDYGQIATYKGTIKGHEQMYILDEKYIFEAHKPVLVCGNTATILKDTYLKQHFELVGDRSRHFGPFGAEEKKMMTTPSLYSAAGPAGVGASKGGCCAWAIE